MNYCDVCDDNEVANEGDVCDDCTTEHNSDNEEETTLEFIITLPAGPLFSL